MEGEPIELNILGFFRLDLALFAEVYLVQKYFNSIYIYITEFLSFQMLATIPAYMVIYSQFLN